MNYQSNEIMIIKVEALIWYLANNRAAKCVVVIDVIAERLV